MLYNYYKNKNMKFVSIIINKYFNFFHSLHINIYIRLINIYRICQVQPKLLNKSKTLLMH